MNLKPLSAQKKTLIWLWTAVDHFKPGILAWVLGQHDSATFEPLWQQVSKWQSYFYVTDGWKVYPCFIDVGEHIVSKTYMIRVEGENTRLRHYPCPTASQNLVLLQVSKDAEAFDSIATSLLKISLYSTVRLIHTLFSNASEPYWFLCPSVELEGFCICIGTVIWLHNGKSQRRQIT